jgi:hypothetical protein
MDAEYTREARNRLANAPLSFAVDDDGQADDGSPRIASQTEFTQVSDAALAAD